MKPLNRTTALAAFATSSLVYVSPALAAGTSDSVSVPALDGSGVALAVVSAAAVVGFVGWGMEVRKRRKVEGGQYMSWMRNSLTGNEIDSWELDSMLDGGESDDAAGEMAREGGGRDAAGPDSAIQAAAVPVPASNADDTDDIEAVECGGLDIPQTIRSVGVSIPEICTVSSDGSAGEAEPVAGAVVDAPVDEEARKRLSVNELIRRRFKKSRVDGDSVAASSDSADGSGAIAPDGAVPAAEPEGADAGPAVEADASPEGISGRGNVPAVAAGPDAGDASGVPGSSDADADEIEVPMPAGFAGSHTREAIAWRKAHPASGIPSGNAASSRASAAAGDGGYVPKHAVLRDATNDTFITNLEDRYSSILAVPSGDGSGESDAGQAPGSLSNRMGAPDAWASGDSDDPVPVSRLDSVIPSIDRAASGYGEPSRSLEMTSADKVANALADRKSLEDAAAEIARAGKISSQASRASAASAKALKDSGSHAVVRNGDVSAEAVIPVNRGPGFVDVNDGTFIREGVAVRVRESRPSPGTRMDGPDDTVAFRDISCTDSISDFPYSVLRRTYYTQGDMVRVEYPESKPSAGAEAGDPKSRTSAGACLQAAAVLSSLPLV